MDKDVVDELMGSVVDAMLAKDTASKTITRGEIFAKEACVMGDLEEQCPTAFPLFEDLLVAAFTMLNISIFGGANDE